VLETFANLYSFWVQVLMDIAGESLEQLAGSAAPRQKVQPAAAAEVEPDEDEALQARLDAVRS